MKIYNNIKRVRFEGEEEESCSIEYDTKGEPFKEGALLEISQGGDSVSCFLEGHELVQIRDFLNKLVPKT